MDGEAWHAAIHGVAKSWTRLSDWTELYSELCSRNCILEHVHYSKAEILYPSPPLYLSQLSPRLLLIYFYCYSVAKLYLTLRYSTGCGMPGSSVLHYLPEFAQVHDHWVSDAIQPSHPLPCISIDLPILQISCKWNHTICVLWTLSVCLRFICVVVGLPW